MNPKLHTRLYFSLFLTFNLLFLTVQLVFVAFKSGNFINAIKLPFTIYIQLFATLGVHISLYIVLSCIQTFMLIGIMRRTWHFFAEEQWQIGIWMISVITLMCANSYFFPLSTFSLLIDIPSSCAYILFLVSLFILGFLVVNSFIYTNRIILFIFLVLLSSAIYWTNYLPKKEKQIQSPMPNIIFLGIDSLSPESVTPINMPFLNNLLQKNTQFTNSISPLARTYPAWSSILTGLYAQHHHAQENLMPKRLVNSQASMVWLLNQKGYNSIFATDDRRFNGIDTDFGFNKIIGPKIGVNDVLLGSFNDFPLSNLMINTAISSWLFPYNYINRASFYLYYPATFSAKLEYALARENANKPLFLAVHFTLPHWPYAWAESSPLQLNNEFSLENRNSLYQASLHRVDTQLHTLFNFLQNNHYMSNSLVILLSDHGEALYYSGSRLTNYNNYQGSLPSRLAEYFKQKTATQLDKSAGHGSDILSPKQYHNVLAFALYKNGLLTTQARQIKTRVALIDIAPTVLAYLNIPSPLKEDGISLLPAIINPKYILPERYFYLESGMCPNQSFSRKKTLELGKLFYWVNPDNDELEIKPNALKAINDQKLYGIIQGDWIFALYPDDKSYIPIIQNLSTGQWSDDFYSRFSKSTPSHKLYAKIRQYYGKQLVFSIAEPIPTSKAVIHKKN